jgi:hypothetical protein
MGGNVGRDRKFRGLAPLALVFLATAGRKQSIRPFFRIVHEAIELKLEAAGFAEVVRLLWKGSGRFAARNGMPPERQDGLQTGHEDFS